MNIFVNPARSPSVPRSWSTGLALVLWVLAGTAAFAESAPIEVRVQVRNRHILVDAHVPLPVNRLQAWSVLTDYDHMAAFLPNLQETRVLSTEGNMLTTFQRGTARYGLFSYDFEVTREVLLSPLEAVHSHLLSGNMKQFDADAVLHESPDGLALDYHSDSVPDYWLPAFVVKPFVEHETRQQFEAMRREMARRYPQ